MNKTILITRPDHDIETKYLYKWIDSIINLSSKRLFRVYDLKGNKVNRKNVESYIKVNKPSIVFINGHGNDKEIMGYDNEIIVDKDSGIPSSIIYARSCESAKILGHTLVEKGSLVFIGYIKKFTFFYDPNCILKPTNDRIARLFLDSSNLVVSTLIKGHTAKEAHERAINAMYKNLKYMISSSATFEERYASSAMWNNITAQVILGDPQAKA